MSGVSRAVGAVKLVRPVLSMDDGEARRRVLSLYKAWYRQIPYIVFHYHIPKNAVQCRAKLREMFYNNQHVKDIRVIDILVIKGQMELKEIVKAWKERSHIMTYFKDTQEVKPTDFMSKFLNGNE